MARKPQRKQRLHHKLTVLLLAFLMGSMSTTEAAVFLHFKLAGGVLLVLRRSIVAVLAFRAGKGNDVSHALSSFFC